MSAWLQEREWLLINDPEFNPWEPANRTKRVLAEEGTERVRQDVKWGGLPGIDRVHGDGHYGLVLGEEFGEACESALEGDMDNLRAELIQIAAVAVAWIEEVDYLGERRVAEAPGEAGGQEAS